MNYITTMSTVSRPNNQYLFQTLTSFGLMTSGVQNVKPHLLVGTPDVEYLSNIQRQIGISPITEEEWSLVKDKGKCEKFNLNFYRCLTCTQENILYLEDDIIFRYAWDYKLDTHLQYLAKEHEDFVLSIYTPYDLSHSPTEYIQFDKGFYGTQGVFFTDKVRAKFADKLMKEGVLNYRHMADLLLQEFCVEENIPLYGLKNPLIQHIGVESSIHGNTFHSNKTF